MDDHEDKAAVGKVWKYVLVDDPKDKASVGEVHGASSWCKLLVLLDFSLHDLWGNSF